MASLKLQIIAALKSWKEEEINLVKKQAKRSKASLKKISGYRESIEHAT